MSIKIVYLDIDVVESIENELSEINDEIAFIKSELLSHKCKKCNKYKMLMRDLNDLQLHKRRIMRIVDMTNPR